MNVTCLKLLIQEFACCVDQGLVLSIISFFKPEKVKSILIIYFKKKESFRIQLHHQ
jgi:hypothetical protein